MCEKKEKSGNGRLCISLAIMYILLTIAVIFLGLGIWYFMRVDRQDGSQSSIVLPGSTIKFVSAIFRHGDRTPTWFYPYDPYKNLSYWPDGLGTLTKVGKLQMHKLGKFLRKRYTELLSSKYSSEDIYVFSSDHDRCLMSAQLCLAGLYPPIGNQIWNAEINWQPIPVHTIPRHLDKLMTAKKPCPRYELELNNTYNLAFFRTINAQNKDVYEDLTHYTGVEVHDVTSVEKIFNTLEVEKIQNLSLPEWAIRHYETMEELASLSLASLTFLDITKMLKGGPLLKEIVDKMSSKILGKLVPDRKMYLYSGHDVTLISFLRALDLDKFEKPGYGAVILLEVTQETNNEDYLVELWYLSHVDQRSPVKLEIPGCEQNCTFMQFLNVTKPLVPLDWENLCQLHDVQLI